MDVQAAQVQRAFISNSLLINSFSYCLILTIIIIGNTYAIVPIFLFHYLVENIVQAYEESQG